VLVIHYFCQKVREGSEMKVLSDPSADDEPYSNPTLANTRTRLDSPSLVVLAGDEEPLLTAYDEYEEEYDEREEEYDDEYGGEGMTVLQEFEETRTCSQCSRYRKCAPPF
jgi:hypothetical protein